MEGQRWSATWQVVPGSGTGELATLQGEGRYVYTHGEPQTPFTFDYDVDS
jgi:Protein of unknown function (DUF3224)